MLTHNRQTRARTNEKSFHKNSHVGIYRNTDNHHTTKTGASEQKSRSTLLIYPLFIYRGITPRSGTPAQLPSLHPCPPLMGPPPELPPVLGATGAAGAAGAACWGAVYWGVVCCGAVYCGVAGAVYAGAYDCWGAV